MQCRYCFGEEDPETMLAPCRCRGTSQYAHEACLQRYLQYYPDRVCRVCNTPLEYERTLDRLLPCLVVPILTSMLMSSETPPATKFVLFLGLLGLSALFALTAVMTSGLLVACGMLGALMLCVHHDTSLTLWALGMLGLTMFIWTLMQYIEPALLLFVLICTITSLYATLFAMAMSTQLDGIALAVFIIQAFLLWSAILQLRPPPNRNPIRNE